MMKIKFEKISESKTFGGWTNIYKHSSEICKGEMKFSVFLPPQADSSEVPILYWLSGLTCNHENFIFKSGVQQYAAKFGIMLIVPDTSPRNSGVEGEDEDYDLGSGAGFYINATTEKWSVNYLMEDYIIKELPLIIKNNFPVLEGRESIFGHSMGGHGALTFAFKYPGRFASVSAFSPICAPSRCPWGDKAFSNYLGNDREVWKKHDANELVKISTLDIPLFIDQGGNDEFLEKELNFEIFKETCSIANQNLNTRLHEGYDHSYNFISTFIGDHILYHSNALNNN